MSMARSTAGAASPAADDEAEQGSLRLVYRPPADMAADVLTKCFPAPGTWNFATFWLYAPPATDSYGDLPTYANEVSSFPMN